MRSFFAPTAAITCICLHHSHLGKDPSLTTVVVAKEPHPNELPWLCAMDLRGLREQLLAQTHASRVVLDEVVRRLARADERVTWDALMDQHRVRQVSERPFLRR